MKEELPKHPDRQRTLLQKIFDAKEWQLLFTPPYTPEAQPIEKVWAYVKHHIASLFTGKRNADTLLVDTILAFYGDPHHAHDGVTPERCRDVIQHVRKWCDDFIDKNMYPGGNLESLATYLRMNPSEEAASDQIEDQHEEEIEQLEPDIFDFLPSDDDED